MQIVVNRPQISKSQRNDQFSGKRGEFLVEDWDVVKPESAKMHFLRLKGMLEVPSGNSILNLKINITESDLGPLYVNPGKDGKFFIHKYGALKKLMDILGIDSTEEFTGKLLETTNSAKGFWIIKAK